MTDTPSQEQAPLGGAASLSDNDSSALLKPLPTSTSYTSSPGLPGLGTKYSIDEITLTSKYYPATQPYLTQFLIQFPKSVSESNIADYAAAASGAEGLLSITPNNLLSVSIQEKVNGIGTFALTIFDPSWEKIENQMIKSKGKFRLRWGYSDQGSLLGDANTTATPWTDAWIVNYSLKFGMEGTTISMTGLLLGYSLNFTKTYNAFGVNGERISDIVKDIASKTGYTPVVEPTAPILTTNSLEETEKVQRIFIQKGETILAFLMNLAEYAKSESSNLGGYKFFIKRPIKAGSKAELHFHTPYYDPTTSPSNKETKKIASVPTFTLHKSPNSPIIDYSPLWDATGANLRGTGKQFSVIIDGTRKSIDPLSTTIKDVPQGFDNQPGCSIFQPYDFNKETNKIVAFSIGTLPDLNPEEQEARLYSRLSTAAIRALRAKLVVQGTTAFQLLDKIAVIVYVPGQGAKIHWTSGFFRIIDIVHSIEAGSYKTTFTLVTDGRSFVGAEFVPVAPGSTR